MPIEKGNNNIINNPLGATTLLYAIAKPKNENTDNVTATQYISALLDIIMSINKNIAK